MGHTGDRAFQPGGANTGDRAFQPGDIDSAGLESPASFEPLDNEFFDPFAEIDIHERNLPHWQQGSVYYFVTWRLADALPRAKLLALQEEKDIWLRKHAEPWDESTTLEYHRLFSQRIDDWLDAGEGSCVLRDPAVARIMADALRHFDETRYTIAAFVVMPNHVHVLFRLAQGRRLEAVLQSWKGYSARQTNIYLRKKGQLWQEEYWDRMIRNERHFERCLRYIEGNPIKARLKTNEFLLFIK